VKRVLLFRYELLALGEYLTRKVSAREKVKNGKAIPVTGREGP
jgi:hypothetical protein